MTSERKKGQGSSRAVTGGTGVNGLAKKHRSQWVKLDLTLSYVKRQTAKMKFLPSDFSSLNSRVKIFVFEANSRRHFLFLCDLMKD